MRKPAYLNTENVMWKICSFIKKL